MYIQNNTGQSYSEVIREQAQQKLAEIKGQKDNLHAARDIGDQFLQQVASPESQATDLEKAFATHIRKTVSSTIKNLYGTSKSYEAAIKVLASGIPGPMGQALAQVGSDLADRLKNNKEAREFVTATIKTIAEETSDPTEKLIAETTNSLITPDMTHQEAKHVAGKGLRVIADKKPKTPEGALADLGKRLMKPPQNIPASPRMQGLSSTIMESMKKVSSDKDIQSWISLAESFNVEGIYPHEAARFQEMTLQAIADNKPYNAGSLLKTGKDFFSKYTPNDYEAAPKKAAIRNFAEEILRKVSDESDNRKDRDIANKTLEITGKITDNGIAGAILGASVVAIGSSKDPSTDISYARMGKAVAHYLRDCRENGEVPPETLIQGGIAGSNLYTAIKENAQEPDGKQILENVDSLITTTGNNGLDTYIKLGALEAFAEGGKKTVTESLKTMRSNVVELIGEHYTNYSSDPQGNNRQHIADLRKLNTTLLQDAAEEETDKSRKSLADAILDLAGKVPQDGAAALMQGKVVKYLADKRCPSLGEGMGRVCSEANGLMREDAFKSVDPATAFEQVRTTNSVMLDAIKKATTDRTIHQVIDKAESLAAQDNFAGLGTWLQEVAMETLYMGTATSVTGGFAELAKRTILHSDYLAKDRNQPDARAHGKVIVDTLIADITNISTKPAEKVLLQLAGKLNGISKDAGLQINPTIQALEYITRGNTNTVQESLAKLGTEVFEDAGRYRSDEEEKKKATGGGFRIGQEIFKTLADNLQSSGDKTLAGISADLAGTGLCPDVLLDTLKNNLEWINNGVQESSFPLAGKFGAHLMETALFYRGKEGFGDAEQLALVTGEICLKKAADVARDDVEKVFVQNALEKANAAVTPDEKINVYKSTLEFLSKANTDKDQWMKSFHKNAQSGDGIDTNMEISRIRNDTGEEMVDIGGATLHRRARKFYGVTGFGK